MRADRSRLRSLWYGFAGLMFAALVAQSLTGSFLVADAGAEADRDITGKVWEWFLPHILPTLGLVGSVSAFAPAPAAGGRDPEKFRYALLLSLFYLCLLALSVLRIPLVSGDPMPGLEQANLWLGPVQGLAAGALGLFFVAAGDGS